MSFSCRICKDKFNVTRLLTEPNAVSEGYSVVSTTCGHLFHLKCLEGALTNQKLLHARHGTGPLRRFCPALKCNADIKSDNESIIPIVLAEDEDRSPSEGGRSDQDTEGKLVKRVQTLMSEKDKLLESIQRADNEVQLLRNVLDEIKFDLAEIQSFLKDDLLMRKGDLIFWITKDGTYAPGKILEIRKKPGESIHYAIVKLDNKTKVPGIGPHAANRDTLILPVSELITFKSFFRGFSDTFQAKFESILVEMNAEIQELASPTGSQSSSERSAAYYRSTRKISRPSPKSNIGSNPLEEMNSSVSVESVPVTAVRRFSEPQNSAYANGSPLLKPNSGPNPNGRMITRSRTIHYGEGNKPRRLEKCRSKSWANPTTRPMLLDSPNESLEWDLELSLSKNSSFQEEMGSSSSEIQEIYFEEDEDENEIPNEFIREGERVIWFDTFSEYEQVGTVAAVCEFSPCAIVQFDEHPIVKHKFQFRTVPLDELFPYDLASAEDKLRIAEIYGKIMEFVESRQHVFSLSNEESASPSECEEIPDFNLEGIKLDANASPSES